MRTLTHLTVSATIGLAVYVLGNTIAQAILIKLAPVHNFLKIGRMFA